jgi:AcrR family transcriptional regulator
MVDTPWGPSESLRDRRLPPGPGRSPQEVARNQRERLFGAMVASVARRGYAATRLSDLTDLSGVSSKSFYELFPDKDACFLATIEALLATVPTDAGAVGFAVWVAAQPAAAKLCLIEAHAGDPAVRERLEAATEAFEARMRRTFRGAAFPPEATTAYMGALLEIARLRLRQSSEIELPNLFATLDGFLAESYSPPPEPLRLTSRGRPRGEEALDASDHAERILQALTLVVAERGYVRTTIDQVIKRAGISASMFYNHFPGKDEALLAAIDSAGARLVAAVLPAFRRSGEWPRALRVGLGALFNQLGARPALAQLLMVEVYAAGPPALQRREEALRPLELLWAGARRHSSDTPPVFFEALPGALYHLSYKRLRERDATALPALAPICSYLALAPFLGANAACEVANAEPRPMGARAPDPEATRATAMLPIRARGTMSIGTELRTLADIAEQLQLPEAVVRQHMGTLERASMVERTEKDGQTLYRSNMGELRAEEWDRFSLAEREDIMTRIRALIDIDLDLSMQSGIFQNRREVVLVRSPLIVDEQGWRELSALHTETLNAAFEVQARAAKRMKESGERGIDVRNIQGMFEMPPEE